MNRIREEIVKKRMLTDQATDREARTLEDYLLRLGMNESRVKVLATKKLAVHVVSVGFNQVLPHDRLSWISRKIEQQFSPLLLSKIGLLHVQSMDEADGLA